MTKSNIVAILPEFTHVDEAEFDAIIISALAQFPRDEYVNEEAAKVYFVAQFYYESVKRTKAMDNMGLKSEKIDDIATVFNDAMSEVNPYTELFNSMIVSNHDCFQVGFMVSS